MLFLEPVDGHVLNSYHPCLCYSDLKNDAEA